MNNYEVILKDDDGNRWTMMFKADDFGHAEEQAKDHLKSTRERSYIIQIVKDYDE